MQCKVDGCGRESMYAAQQVCQKHYFRFMRTGQYELQPRRGYQPRQENAKGYQWVYGATHPLRFSGSPYVAEHRKVLFDHLGPGPLACELCAKSLTWATCHVDHKDEDVRNNALANLRPTCNVCNTRRGMRPPEQWSRTHKITFEGVTKTPAQWARDPRVKVTGHTIIVRKSQGASDEEALFAPKKTHNGNHKRALYREKCKEVLLNAF